MITIEHTYNFFPHNPHSSTGSPQLFTPIFTLVIHTTILDLSTELYPSVAAPTTTATTKY